MGVDRIVATVYGASGNKLSGDWKSYASTGKDAHRLLEAEVERSARVFLSERSIGYSVLLVEIQNADGSPMTFASASGRFEVTYA
ncbi:hypothetical protein [Pelagicoccus sp. SDUM812002]|uniref:hypothetical protein n=1 Tax=Pelagicoccus sp. SDUM812002 TaxID=3041266 RepID=UPI0028106CE8|nr:hypothetical protein [Pelagicoccus sp. SDUM812002]MDQ8184231.1 hypothetical protein [Pelagicoccus sp. SDUM812002]